MAMAEDVVLSSLISELILEQCFEVIDCCLQETTDCSVHRTSHLDLLASLLGCVPSTSRNRCITLSKLVKFPLMNCTVWIRLITKRMLVQK